MPRDSHEQSHRDAPSCAHLRATWCIKDRQPDHNQGLENPYKDMHVINIHAAHMPCMNSRYHCNSLQSTHLLITLTECTQRSQACDPTLQQTSGSKVGLSTDKFNKWLREALSKNKPSTRDQTAVWNYTTKVIVELQGGDSFGVRVLILKT